MWPKAKVNDPMYFLVNASPPEPFGIIILQLQTLQSHRSHDVEGTGKHFMA